MSVRVESPITGRSCDGPIGRYRTDEILIHYRQRYRYDVTRFFKGVDDLGLYVCPDTGYQFFFPGVEGDGDFYRHLHGPRTNFMSWKWEHSKAVEYIEEGNVVLEIGSAVGGFLSGLSKQRRVNVQGLEINPGALESAALHGIRLFNESLAQHASRHVGFYDVVCSFQVLEHIYSVGAFLKSVVLCLKPGGRFIVSVPDYDSFVGVLDPISDRPPHHVGRYTMTSLEKSGHVFGLKTLAAIKEPLQEYHYSAVEGALLGRLFGKKRVSRKIFLTLGGRALIRKIVSESAAWMNGHTLFMVFVKPNNTV